MGAEVVIGRYYPEGNLQGQHSYRIKMAKDPWVDFNHISPDQRTSLQVNPETGEERELRIPQF